MMLSRFFMGGKGKREARAYFPHDILADILLRLSVKSIIRLKAVDSSWLRLISSPEFCVKHLHDAPASHKHGVIEIRNQHSAYPCLSLRRLKVDFEVELIDIESPFGEVYHNTYIRAAVLGSCHGLLLVCVINRDKMSRDFLLWNPSTREHERISSSIYMNADDIVGLGYDGVNDNYKLVDVSLGETETDTSINVYNLKEGQWERKNQKFPYQNYINQPGITLANGILHWLVLNSKGRLVIISFDSVQEIFKELPLLPTLYPLTSISTLYGYLCIGSVHSHNLWMGLWIMREYGVQQSWIKLNISFPQPPKNRFLYPFRPLQFLNKDHVIMDLYNKTILIYSPTENQYNTILLSPHILSVATYVESLISPKIYKKDRYIA